MKTPHSKFLVPTQSAYDRLLTVRLFAFGIVGFEGGISGGEMAFKAVIRKKNAAESFESIAKKGTPEAKLYALCGFRRLNDPAYFALAEALKAENPDVRCMGGCIRWTTNALAIVNRIDAGDYDHVIGVREKTQKTPG